jgi:hypothetical protein
MVGRVKPFNKIHVKMMQLKQAKSVAMQSCPSSENFNDWLMCNN